MPLNQQVTCIAAHCGNQAAYAGRVIVQDDKPFRGCIGMADVEYRNTHYGRRITTYPTRERLKIMTKLVEIEGIGATYASKLEAADIKSLEALLEQGSTKKGRKALEDSTGISGKLILRWVNMADLFRVKGIGEQYSDLLEAAGVDTVPELAQRKPENLHSKMVEVNEAKNLVRATPSLSSVEKWVAEAKQLPRVVTY